MDRLMRRDAIAENEPKLVGLIENEYGERGEQPHHPNPSWRRWRFTHRQGAIRLRAHGHRPSAASSRNACASRGVTSGNSASLPTSGEIFHERAHLRPAACTGTTATPATSGRRKASAG